MPAGCACSTVWAAGVLAQGGEGNLRFSPGIPRCILNGDQARAQRSQLAPPEGAASQRSGHPVPVNFVRLETLLEAEEFRQNSAYQCDPLKAPLLVAGSHACSHVLGDLSILAHLNVTQSSRLCRSARTLSYAPTTYSKGKPAWRANVDKSPCMGFTLGSPGHTEKKAGSRNIPLSRAGDFKSFLYFTRKKNLHANHDKAASKQETLTRLGESSPGLKYSAGPLAENWTQDNTALPPSASFWKVYREEPFVLYLHSAFWKLKQNKTTSADFVVMGPDILINQKNIFGSQNLENICLPPM